MKKSVIYARYSSERQTEQSIDGQLRVCREYAERNNLVIIDTYIDRAMSGTNDNRTAFQRLLKDSAKRAWDVVLVYKLDRFSRNKYEMAIHKRTLRDFGVRLVSAMENIPDTPEGIILESLLEGMAEYYSAELSQKVRRGLNESRLKGNFTGGFLLFGYRLENKKILIDEPQAQIVRRIFEEYASGKLIKDIILALHAAGVTHRGKPFSKNTVYNLLKNEKYAGIYRHGEQVFTDIYPRIVPEDVFEIVRCKVKNNKYGKHKPDIVYLLKHKLICGYCGKPVNSESGTSRNGTVMRYYKCSGKRTDKSCPLSPVRKDLLEQIVLESTYEALASPDNLNFLADRILTAHRQRLKAQSVLKLLEKDLNDTGKAIANLLDALEKGVVTASTKTRLEQLEARQEDLRNKLEQEKAKSKLLLTKSDVLKFIAGALHKNPQQMIHLLIRKIILYSDRVEIYYNYTSNKDPDDDCSQGLSFFSCTKSFTIDYHKFDTNPTALSFQVVLFI